MYGQLVPCNGGDAIPLVKSKVLVGRHHLCDIRIPVPDVSGRHCELEFRNDYWFVRDLNSTNGIRVQGELCDGTWVLPGEELMIARQRYMLDYIPPGDAEPPVTGRGPAAHRDTPDLAQFGEAGQLEGVPFEGVPLEGMTRSGDIQALGQLVPQGGGATIPLTRSRLTVGRHSSCEIVLRHPTVSSRHCQLELVEGYWLVRDLNSRNGIRIDGVPAETQWLWPGTTLTIAILRYSVEYTQTNDDPPPSVEVVNFARTVEQKNLDQKM